MCFCKIGRYKAECNKAQMICLIFDVQHNKVQVVFLFLCAQLSAACNFLLKSAAYSAQRFLKKYKSAVQLPQVCKFWKLHFVTFK